MKNIELKRFVIEEGIDSLYNKMIFWPNGSSMLDSQKNELISTIRTEMMSDLCKGKTDE